MTDSSYNLGYSHGFYNVAPSYQDDSDYELGYEDGQGDSRAGAKPSGVKSAFIDTNFYIKNSPPEGYGWAGEYRTPQKGEVYLTKNGNAGIAKTPRQQRNRHILTATTRCNRRYYGRDDPRCTLKHGHAGKHSWELDH
jgi:hypothetical protein